MAQIDVELYPQQFKFATSRARMTAFVGGIGSGKTFAGAVRVVYEVAEVGGLGEVIAPTYPMLRDATMRTLRELAQPLIAEENRSEMRWRLANGAEILFRSADEPERLRGPNLSWVWLDEAALCPPQTWPIVIGRLRAGGRAGRAWMTATPRGRNWLFQVCKSGEVEVFRASTMDNPHLDEEFVASLQRAYTGEFARQELHGEFISLEGLVYDEFNRTTHVVRRDDDLWTRVVAGVDEGYTNPAVILVVGLDTDGRAHVIDEFYRRRALRDEFVAAAREFQQRYGVELFCVDPSAAGLIAEMQAAGLPAVAADNRVREGVQVVKAALQVAGDGRPRLTVSPVAANTIAEFEAYVWAQGRAGLKDEPEKTGDHAMDALRYALMAAQNTAGRLLLWD